MFVQDYIPDLPFLQKPNTNSHVKRNTEILARFCSVVGQHSESSLIEWVSGRKGPSESEVNVIEILSLTRNRKIYLAAAVSRVTRVTAPKIPRTHLHTHTHISAAISTATHKCGRLCVRCVANSILQRVTHFGVNRYVAIFLPTLAAPLLLLQPRVICIEMLSNWKTNLKHLQFLFCIPLAPS